MTTQPTTRIQTPFAPQGPNTPAGQAAMPLYGAAQPPVYGAPQPLSQPAFPPSYTAGGYPAPASPQPGAPRRNIARVVGIVSAVLVALAGIGTAALFVFGPRTVDPQSVQQEIVRITQTAVAVAPADVHCPTGVKAAAGDTFTCTGTVEGQPVTYQVHQDDAKGHLTITYDRLITVGDIESAVARQVGKDIEVAVKITCEPAGRTVVVNHPGTPIACIATNADDPTDNAKINVSVAADGTPSYSFA